MNRPPWLNDEPEILALLRAFLDRLDRQERDDAAPLKAVRIEHKRFPALFRHDSEADLTWELLGSLAEDDGPLEIYADPKRAAHEAPFAGARVRLKPGFESLLRDWLARPRPERDLEQWRSAVSRHAGIFADGGAALAARIVSVEGKSAEEIVAAFASIEMYLDARLTLRQLSARCFWGHSKYLDSREELLTALFPTLRLAARPVIVNVRLPSSIQGVLFVENQDNYVRLLKEEMGSALIYAAGFRGSAQRIRSLEGASLHYAAGSDPAMQARFEAWWFSEQAAPFGLWFWGDLDFAGMAILKALRSRFGDVRAWAEGYQPMLEQLQQGHAAASAGKEEQSDPGRTGCPYADEVLLPALRRQCRFVDQEAL